ncbi:CRE-UGT-54 protein, partial [Aphelenchoides avenae]
QAADLDCLFRGEFGSDFPGIEKLVANLSLVFVNSNEFFDIAKPWSHKVITIGGIVDKKPKPLSEKINAIFAKAEKGVVLFSLGSLTNTTKMSYKLKRTFLEAFAKFSDVHFIWKLQTTEDGRQMLKSYPNVHTFEWLDQVSILAHSKTRAFISHCGINSANEAGAHGVPVVGIPLFSDQLYNAALIQRKRMGIYVDTTTMSTETLYQALNEVLSNP